MRVHLIGLPHTETTKAFSWCAFTEKTRKLAGMLTSLGYDVRLYAGEANEAPCTEHVPVIDRAWQARHFGGYVWERDVFNDFDPNRPHWQEMNARVIAAIAERCEPGDILGLTMGHSQRPIAEALADRGLFTVEVGIGYRGVWAPYRVIESYAWRHFLAALEPTDDVRYYDAVIPNSFESPDFPAGSGQGGYYAFLGRFIRRKGVEIAVETTKVLGAELRMAGQGITGEWHGPDGVVYRGIDLAVEGPHLCHIGVLGPEARARFLGDATAVFAPSIYLEPFCGVAVEAMMCGTPVITTDHGAMTETVQQGVTGYRCNTLADFVAAAKAAPSLDRDVIRSYAHGRYSTDVVRHSYDAYFRRLATLQGAGWYALDEGSRP